MRRVTLHLGADNATGRIDRERVAEVVASYWGGATILWGTGVWQGGQEESAMILVYTDAGRDQVKSFADLLQEEFKQEEVIFILEELP